MSRATPNLALATNPPSGQKQEDSSLSGSTAPPPTNGLSHEPSTNGHSHNTTKDTAMQDGVAGSYLDDFFPH